VETSNVKAGQLVRLEVVRRQDGTLQAHWLKVENSSRRDRDSRGDGKPRKVETKSAGSGSSSTGEESPNLPRHENIRRSVDDKPESVSGKGERLERIEVIDKADKVEKVEKVEKVDKPEKVERRGD
jgi:hypothetical protein